VINRRAYNGSVGFVQRKMAAAQEWAVGHRQLVPVPRSQAPSLGTRL